MLGVRTLSPAPSLRVKPTWCTCYWSGERTQTDRWDAPREARGGSGGRTGTASHWTLGASSAPRDQSAVRNGDDRGRTANGRGARQRTSRGLGSSLMIEPTAGAVATKGLEVVETDVAAWAAEISGMTTAAAATAAAAAAAAAAYLATPRPYCWR